MQPSTDSEPHCKRLHRIEKPGDARFLTFSCEQRLPLLGTPALRDAFVQQLGRAQEQEGFDLLAWVVMPEHVHLALRPNLPHWPVDRIVKAIKQPFAQRVIHRWKVIDAPILARITDRTGRVRYWLRGGGYDRNVAVDGELIEKIHYIHANPVRRGLVERMTDWEWSSARWYEGNHTSVVKVASHLLR